MSELHEKLDRIERKLDALIAALAEEEQGDDVPAVTLDGEQAGAERDSSQPL